MASYESGIPKNKAELIAKHLLDRIINQNLKPGDSCGTEAELLTQFDVSRPTLRECLRILEAQGVLELRPGPRGGILVARPGIDSLAHSLSVFLRLNDVPFLAVLRAREVIEPALATEAAQNATAEEIVELQESVERMKSIKDQAAFLAENRRFHSLIASASRNEVMSIFWSTISILAAGEMHGVKYSSGNQKHVVNAHQAIVDAIASRQPRLAADLMQEHLLELEKLLGKHYKSIVERATDIVDRRGRQI